MPLRIPHPIKAANKLNNIVGLLATLTILALGLSVVAIIFAIGDTNATPNDDN